MMIMMMIREGYDKHMQIIGTAGLYIIGESSLQLFVLTARYKMHTTMA